MAGVVVAGASVLGALSGLAGAALDGAGDSTSAVTLEVASGDSISAEDWG